VPELRPSRGGGVARSIGEGRVKPLLSNSGYTPPAVYINALLGLFAMEPNHYLALDFGGYLYGMFFAGGFMMGSYGIYAAIKSTKGIYPPLVIVSLIVGYLWWTGDIEYLIPDLTWG
jgi:hypothetical protein